MNLVAEIILFEDHRESRQNKTKQKQLNRISNTESPGINIGKEP